MERGHLESLSIRVIRRVGQELDVRVDLNARMRTGDLDRLVNAGHAQLHDWLATYLGTLPGWVHSHEVSFAIYGERGVIDILAFHQATGALLIIELKTELVSIEDLLTTMDVRMRLATQIAKGRGWDANSVSSWVILADTPANRRRLSLHAATLRSVFPTDGRSMRGWLRQPQRSVRAISMWRNSNAGGATRVAALRRRVRPATHARKAA